jgi:hypothetical protein
VNIEIIILAMAVPIMLAFVLGVFCGERDGVKQVEHEAVKNGHAEWVPDEHGRATFQWKNGGAK